MLSREDFQVIPAADNEANIADRAASRDIAIIVLARNAQDAFVCAGDRIFPVPAV